MDALKSIHFYRKVPRDLTEATLAGGTISLISSIVMAYLFITNFSAYLRVDTKTSIVLDASQEKKLQLNFNVTLYHLPCRFATLDIVDVMGTDTVDAVMARVFSLAGEVVTPAVYLAHNGTKLEGARTIADYKIAMGATLVAQTVAGLTINFFVASSSGASARA